MLSGDFSATLARISVKAALKKILFDHLEPAIASFLVNPAGVPLTTASGETPIVYHSAIALKLAALGSLSTPNSWHRWIEIISEQMNTKPNQPISQTGLASAIADHWQVTADTQGGILLTLNSHGIATWLQQVYTVIPPSITITGEPARLAKPPGPQCWLGQHLRLSGPMTLQFGHARCWTWLHDLQQQSTQPLVQLGDQGSLVQGHGRMVWSDHSPKACHRFLQAIARAIDTMADHADDPVACLRQGYALSHAVYEFQGAVPFATVSGQPATIQDSTWSLVLAAQRVLALVISVWLRQTPMHYL